MLLGSELLWVNDWTARATISENVSAWVASFFFIALSFQWAITLLDRGTQSTSMTLTSFSSRRRMPTLHRANSNVNDKCKSGFSLLIPNQLEQVKVFQATSWTYRLLVILHCSVQIFHYRIF